MILCLTTTCRFRCTSSSQRSCAARFKRRELTGRVPSILTLAQEHEVSHRTAARALTTLRDEALMISVTGKGYYVR